MTITCPNCGRVATEEALFCDHCGLQLRSPGAPDNLPAGPRAHAVANATEASSGSPEGQPAPQAPAPESGPAPAAPAVCPSCGFPGVAAFRFCPNCGVRLSAAEAGSAQAYPGPAGPAPAAALPPLTPDSEPPPTSPGLSPVASPGRLVINSSTNSLPLLPGKAEFLIGRTDPMSGIYPDLDLTPFGGEIGGVSRRHARLLVKEGQVFLEDLNSTNFTFLNRQRVPPGQRQPLKDGDEIRFGKLVVKYYSK